MVKDLSDFKASGQIARLIPIVADSKKEERATSCLLASFMVVPLFAQEVLSDAGAPVGKRVKISCWTEVAFKASEQNKSLRPDGLIIVKSSKKTWTALVESKIGNSELTKEQVEDYLDLARVNGIDAVITISNQFATTPAHHPIKVSKGKLRSVELYHFSWLSLKSRALLITSNKQVADPEQAYILSELVRYMNHDSSGITALTRVPSEWKDVCNAVLQKAALAKTSDIVAQTVSGWHQLLRHLALELSIAVGQPVSIVLSRARVNDAELNFREDCGLLTKENCLVAQFDIPNAAATVSLSADFMRRSVEISMKLQAPKDRSRATASINWLTKQLRSANTERLSIRAYWPKRRQPTSLGFGQVMELPSGLVPEGMNDIPTYLEVFRVIELSARFKGAKTFVEDVSREFPLFYKDAGEHLSKWVAKAPKVREPKVGEPIIPTVFTDAEMVAPSVIDD